MWTCPQGALVFSQRHFCPESSVTRKSLIFFSHFFIGPGPFPAVINMYGGINRGQVIEDKSAMFASRGIASLALAFFGVPDLPKKYVQ